MFIFFHPSVGWKLEVNHCKSDCKTGEFWTGTECKQCEASCQECSGPNNTDCISCKELKFLDTFSNHCIAECPDGFYGDLTTTHCKACPMGCKQCSGNKCTACLPELLLIGESCLPHCPSGTYLTKAKTCKPCDNSCLECASSPSHCVKCHSNDVLNGSQCSSVCPSGTFLDKDSKKCLPCDPQCAECSGPSPSQCTKCNSSLKVGSTCLKSCPAQTYYNDETQQCQPCDFYCQSCKGGKTVTLQMFRGRHMIGLFQKLGNKMDSHNFVCLGNKSFLK